MSEKESTVSPLTVRGVFQELKKIIRQGDGEPSKDGESIKERLHPELERDLLGYVLITCDQPTEEGKMQVRLSYGGEVDLASFLVENAHVFFEQKLLEDN